MACDGISSFEQDLSHNYVHLPPESKVELHVYSIVLLYCLHSLSRTGLELHGAIFAKVCLFPSLEDPPPSPAKKKTEAAKKLCICI